MVEKRALLVLLLATSLAGSATAASAAGRPTGFRPAGTNAVVAQLNAQSDSRLTALRILREQLILAFRISHGVVMVDLDLPTTDNDYQLDGMQDGTDGVDPLGAKDNGLRQDGPIPETSNTPVR